MGLGGIPSSRSARASRLKSAGAQPVVTFSFVFLSACNVAAIASATLLVIVRLPLLLPMLWLLVSHL